MMARQPASAAASPAQIPGAALMDATEARARSASAIKAICAIFFVRFWRFQRSVHFYLSGQGGEAQEQFSGAQTE